MKIITNDYKEAITRLGRQFKNKINIYENIYLTTEDDKLILTQNDMKLIVGVSDTVGKILEDDMLFNINLSRKTRILATGMKELDFESYEDIRVGNIVEYEFGLLTDEENDGYEWINYGKYIVYSKQFNEDTKTYSYVCYDNMLKTMVPVDNETQIDNVTIKNAINNMAKRFKYNIKEKSKNMLNVQEGFELGYINGTGTFVAENQTALFNQYIPVEASTKYTISSNTRVQNMNIVYYDSDKTFISRTGTQTQISSRTITTPANATYIRFQFSYNGSSTVTQQIIDGLELQAELGEERTTYEEYFNINEEYTNLTKTIAENTFTSVDNTYRDVLDMICQAIGTTMILDNNNLYLKSLKQEPVDTIGKEFLKNTNVSFGKKYGPINTLVLSKGDNADIEKKDLSSIKDNGSTIFKIKDNLILKNDDRNEYLEGIFNEINGTEFYLNDISSTGIGYIELMDYYNIEIDNTTYKCLMLDTNFKVRSGLSEEINSEEPEETDTEFSTSTKTTKDVTMQINQQKSDIDNKINRNEVIFGINNSTETRTIDNTRLNMIINNNENNLTNIESYDTALQKVYDTDIYSFNFLNDSVGAKKTIGFVKGNTQYTDDIVGEKDGFTGANLLSMISVLWQAVKEIQITPTEQGVTLYEDATGSNTTITLSDNLANYECAEIDFKTNDGSYHRMKFPSPYGTIELFTIRSTGTGTGSVYLKSSVWTIADNILTSVNHQEVNIRNGNSPVISGNNQTTIVKVVGYK